MKANSIVHLILCMLMVLALAVTADAQASRKTRHKRHKPLPRVDTTIVHPDLVDTTAFDTLTDVQKRLLAEVNRWGAVRYHRGGLTKQGIDCSGFTCRVFNDALSVALPRTSREQARLGERIDRDDLALGDLLFFTTRLRKRRIGHVGIYIGDGKFVHSSRSGVRVDSLEEAYFKRRYVTARRVLIDTAADTSLVTE